MDKSEARQIILNQTTHSMKQLLTTLTLFILSAAPSTAQQFKPGWYIVEKGAEYVIFAPGYLDFDNKGRYNLNEVSLNAGEVVFIWEKSKDLYISNEWFGRIVLFDNTDKLTPVPEGKIGYLLNDIQDLNGKIAAAGSAVWITDYNTATKTVTILLNEGKKVSIPATDITILANFIQESLSAGYKKRTAQ